MKNTTNVVVVVDQSGSMTHLRQQTIENFNEFLEEQKKSNSDIVLTTVFFNTSFDKYSNNEDIKKVKKLTEEDYNPNGLTALYDAIGFTLKENKKIIKELQKEERPEKNMLVIITDGQENSSKEYNRDDIFKKIKKLEDKKWLVMYLGANQDSFIEGGKMGINANSTLDYDFSTSGSKTVWRTVSATAAMYSNTSDTDFVTKYNIKSVVEDEKGDE